MSRKTLTLSIIIPAYNEERYLGACLESIANQTVRPKEVIVVDNNSTDKTVEVAQRFPFVTVLHEKRQHQAFAQATGFSAASGDIFARIDADTVLPPTWVTDVTELFADDREMVAFNGHPDPYDVPVKWPGVFLLHLYHCVFTRLHAGHVVLWGSNCAFRGSLWLQVKPKLHLRPDIWEDYDLAFALAPLGDIRHVPAITVGCSFRSLQRPFLQQLRYHFRAVRAFYLNTSLWRTLLQGLLRGSVLLFWPLALIEQAYSRIKNLPKAR